jgi:hypothetical protein
MPTIQAAATSCGRFEHHRARTIGLIGDDGSSPHPRRRSKPTPQVCYPSSLADCVLCRRLNVITAGSLQGLTRGSLQARLEIVLRCDAFSFNASPAPSQRRRGGIAGRLLGGIASRGFAATGRVHLRDQHFEAGVGLGLTEGCFSCPCAAVRCSNAATHAKGSKTVRSAASSRAEGSRTPES